MIVRKPRVESARGFFFDFVAANKRLRNTGNCFLEKLFLKNFVEV